MSDACTNSNRKTCEGLKKPPIVQKKTSTQPVQKLGSPDVIKRSPHENYYSKLSDKKVSQSAKKETYLGEMGTLCETTLEGTADNLQNYNSTQSFNGNHRR